MNDTFISECLLYSELPLFHRRVARAEQIIVESLARDVRWAVSFSGGKDSTVLLDLVLKYRPEIEIVFFDEGWDYPETLDFIDETSKRLNKQILRITIPVTASFWKNEVDYRGDDPLFDHAGDLTEDEWSVRFGGSFIGLRKDESRARRITLRGKGALYFNKSLGHWHSCPLADWSYLDVWSYIFKHSIPYNRVYDRLNELGVSVDMMRVGPLTAWMVWQYGALAWIKRGWPDLFNRFASIFPEARNFV